MTITTITTFLFKFKERKKSLEFDNPIVIGLCHWKQPIDIDNAKHLRLIYASIFIKFPFYSCNATQKPHFE